MNSIRIVLATLALGASACTITQEANPVQGLATSPSELCVIEKRDVRQDFRDALLAELGARGFPVRELPEGSPVDTCEWVLTYDARYSWDFVIYMAWAEIVAHRGGSRAGDALYSAPRAGWSLTTRIYEPTESKVRTMVDQLFPAAQ